MFAISRSILRQFFTCIICDILIVDNGFHEGWSTPMLPKFGKTDPIEITPDRSVLVVNSLYIGTGVGAIFLFFIMSRVGRKTILLGAALPKMLSWILFAAANSYTLICLARFSAGLSHGVTFTVLSIYQCEITSEQIRGTVGAVMSDLINTSVLVIYVTAMWLPRFTTSMMALAIQVIFFGTFLFCPESPYFLIRKNKQQAAEQTLKWLLNREDVKKELEGVERIVAKEDALANSNLVTQIRQVFSKRENRRAAVIAIILATALTWCGCAPIFAYQSYTFSAAGFDLSTNVSITLTGVSNIVGGLACILSISRLGKRPILLIAMPIICFSLLIIAVFFSLMERNYDVKKFNWIPTLFIVVYIFAYGFSLYPLVYTYMGEIFPYEMKAPAAISFAIFFSVSSVCTVQIYQILQSFGLDVPFWFFGCNSFVMWILIYYYAPETEHKTLEQILLELQSSTKKTESHSVESAPNEKYIVRY